MMQDRVTPIVPPVPRVPPVSNSTLPPYDPAWATDAYRTDPGETGPADESVQGRKGGSYRPGTDLTEVQALVLASYRLPVYPVYAFRWNPDANGDDQPFECSCGRPDEAKCTPGKHPACAHGKNDATTDPQTICEMNFVGRNIGIRTGGWFFALDVDNHTHIKEKDDPNGMESLAKMEANFAPMPVTWTVRTGSGARHFYFKMPADKIVRSSNTKLNQAGYRGIEILSDGEAVIAPPSTGPLGEYTWVPGRAPWECPLANAPVWLLPLLVTVDQGRAAPEANRTDGPTDASGRQKARQDAQAGTGSDDPDLDAAKTAPPYEGYKRQIDDKVWNLYNHQVDPRSILGTESLRQSQW